MLRRAGTCARKALVAALLASAMLATPALASGDANLWVDRTADDPGVRCSIACAYVAEDAFPSLDEAYQAASAGDLIYIKGDGGTPYGDQIVADRPGLGTTAVEVHPAPGETVHVSGRIEIRTHDFVVDGGDAVGTNEENRIIVSRTSPTSQFATFGMQDDGSFRADRNIVLEDVKGDSLYITAPDSTFRFSELGPLDACAGTDGTPHDGIQDMIASTHPVGQGLDDIVIEGNYLHDITLDCPEDDEHADLMDINFSGESKIVGNRIVACGTQCIFNTPDQGHPDLAVTIENNFIACPDDTATCDAPVEVQSDGDWSLNYNTIKGYYRSGPAEASELTAIGNLWLEPQVCENGLGGDDDVMHSYSVFPTSQDDTCDATNTGADVTFSDDPNDGLFHIAEGSHAAVSQKGDPGYCPATDYDRQTRPQPSSTTCDVGADEVSSKHFYVTPSGTGVSCSLAAPCDTIDEAYQLADPGDIVIVAAGSYGDEYVRWDSGKAADSDNVEIVPVPGATPAFDGFGTEARDVTIVGPFRSETLETNGTGANTITDVLVKDVTVDGQGTDDSIGYVADANGLTWENVDIGDNTELPLVLVEATSSNVTFDHVDFHDNYRDRGSSAGASCLAVNGGNTVAIKGSQFSDCTNFDLFVTSNGTSTHDLLLENNVFEDAYVDGIPGDVDEPVCCASYNLRFHSTDGDVDGLTIRNNTFEGVIAWPSSPFPSGASVVGNTFSAECEAGITFAHNLNSGDDCGGTNTEISSAERYDDFADPDAHDFHLVPDADAVDAAGTSDYTITDRDGIARYVGDAADAGAYERPPTIYMDDSGVRGAPCTEEDPCRNLDEAYDLALPGAVVQVGAGTYSGTELAKWDVGKAAGSPNVTIRPAPGSTPEFDAIGIEARDVSVIGPFVAGRLTTNGANGRTITDVLVEDVTIDGDLAATTLASVGLADGVIWRNVDVGYNTSPELFSVDGTTKNLTLDRVEIHDQYLASVPGSVNGCLRINGGEHITIQRSRIHDCTTRDIYVREGPGDAVTEDLVLENNVLERPYVSGIPGVGSGPTGTDDYDIQFHATFGDVNGLTMRNNTLEGPVGWPSDGFPSGATVVGNTFEAACKGGVTFRHNVNSNGTQCHATDTQVTSGQRLDDFVDPAAHDFHLVANADALDAASPTDYPALDIDGDARYNGAAADAGAYERRPTPVAAYAFEETSGTTTADAAGNNDGTLVGATFTASGKNGRGVHFDGVDDYVTIADDAALDLTTGMTLEAWVYPTSLGANWRTVMVKEQAGNLVYGLYASEGGGDPGGHAYIGGADQSATGPTAAIVTNAWQHLAVTYDGSTIRLYKDGTEIAAHAASGSITTSSGALKLGGNAIWGEWFAGEIDDVRVFDRALTPAMIAADRDSGV